MSHPSEPSLIAEGKYLRLVSHDGWEFVSRKTATGVVIVVAITEQRRVLFAEQFRPPVGHHCIEFPAGLAGDVEGAEEETFAEAARRELLEETGYMAGELTKVFHGPSSAGLTDEMCHIFLARELRREGSGGGDHSEEIVVHEIDVDDVEDWLEQKAADGFLVGARVYAGLHFLRRFF